MSSEKTRQVRIARVGKPHGIRGEVSVELFTDSPDRRFATNEVVAVQHPDKSPMKFNSLTVQNARWHQKILLVKFIEIADRNSAEQLRGAELFVALEESSEDEEAWYPDELIGLYVYLGDRSSTEIGEVINLIIGPAQDLLEIKLLNGNKALVPFVAEIVPEIDEERGAIVIKPPPGLLELNQD